VKEKVIFVFSVGVQGEEAVAQSTLQGCSCACSLTCLNQDDPVCLKCELALTGRTQLTKVLIMSYRRRVGMH